MPAVKLKVNRWLRQSVGLGPAGPEEISISILEGESILGMLARLATEQGGSWKSLFGEKPQEIGANILVVLNGCLVNPYDRSEAPLKDGDEVTLLPMFDGG